MTLEVELRPGARRDLTRFEAFLKKMSARAADRRIDWLQRELRKLGDNPHRGQSLGRQRYQLVLRYARSTYVLRYKLTPDKVQITRIWHGKEDRPR